MEHCCFKELVFACRNQAKRSVIRVLMKFPQCVSSVNTRGKTVCVTNIVPDNTANTDNEAEIYFHYFIYFRCELWP